MNFPFPRSDRMPDDAWNPPRFLVLSSTPRELSIGRACKFVFGAESGFDGIMVLDGQGVENVRTVIRQSNNYLAPVANLSGTPLPFADFEAAARTPETMSRAIEELSRIIGLIRTIPEEVRMSDAPETILLARAYSRKRVIEPVYDPSVRDCVIYPVGGLLEDTGRCAERMTNAGYFTRMFFDRLHACPDCGSSRLNAREECVACRSADLANEPLVHHLRCGHRGLEAEFRQNNLLICPKCHHELRVEGGDYEKPGRANACGCCGHINSQSSNQQWQDRDAPRIGPSPQEAVVRQALRLHTRYGRPLAILKITFGEDTVSRETDTPCSLTAASVRVAEVLREETRETDVVIETENGFLVYMPETPSDGVDSPSTRLRNRIGSSVPADLDVKVRALRPDDLKPLMLKSF